MRSLLSLDLHRKALSVRSPCRRRQIQSPGFRSVLLDSQPSIFAQEPPRVQVTPALKMVYIKKWAEFQAACTTLYEASPDRTRYVIKARPADHWLVLKVTDDFKTIKYKTRSSIILNRFESFNRDMMALMAGQEPPSRVAARKQKQEEEEALARAQKAAAAAATAGKDQAADGKNAGKGVDGANQTSAQGQGQSGGGGSSNKKKKKKGKK